jgi:hypothetical protein
MTGRIVTGPDEPLTDLEELMGAVARGWCHPENAEKVMDCDLAEAIVDEVLPLLHRKIDTAVQRAEEAEAECDHLRNVAQKRADNEHACMDALAALSARAIAAEAERDRALTLLGVLANRRDSLPGWARELLAPWVVLTEPEDQ